MNFVGYDYRKERADAEAFDKEIKVRPAWCFL